MREPAATWHVGPDAMRHWVDGVAAPASSASIEQHVLDCEHCRATVATLVPAAQLDAIWDDVLAEVEVPHPGPARRLLLRLGLSSSDALVIGSAVTMRAPWILGTLAVLTFAVVCALYTGSAGVALFLMVAPLIPIGGVAAAYGPSTDPAYEVALVSPYAMVRLVLLRTSSVLATSVPVVVAAGLLLPTSPSVAVAWLLPAAGFVVLVLTASSWVDPVHAATAVALAWVTAVGYSVVVGDPLLVLAPPALLGYTAAGLVVGAVLLHRLLGSSPSWRLR